MVHLWVASAACFAGFLMLGYAVSHAPFLSRIDSRGVLARGHALALAALFTYSGRATPLTVFGCIAIATIAALHAGVAVAIGVCIAQLCSQAVVQAAKGSFRRVRPERWLLRAESGFSYPSGHAATAVLFFGSWLVYVVTVARVQPDAKAALSLLLSLWIAGIGWSRVALGAHYPIDVAGGALVGLSTLCVAWAIFLYGGLLAWH